MPILHLWIVFHQKQAITQRGVYIRFFVLCFFESIRRWPCIRQKVGDDPVQAFRLAKNHIKKRCLRRVCRNAAAQKLKRRTKGTQRISYFLCEPGGHPSNGGEPVGTAK